MIDSIRKEMLGKQADAQHAYAKGMEMIGVFSAGTIGIVVAIRPAGSSNIETQAALFLLFISMIGTVIWFMGRGVQYLRMAESISKNPTKPQKISEPLWARTSRILVVASFILAYWMLFSSI
ncbi:MAG: hypothetical protein HKN50_08795 [Gammaproteobacteria bacterium]|nr:hypothetical protein [Gammaproteobacteria bacterium]